MKVMHSLFARALFALLLIVSGAVSAAGQSATIQSRTPSRGGTGGGTTVEVLGSGWFGSFGTSVTMAGGATQPTNVVVHSPTRLTFVTPPRAVGACPSSVCVVTVSYTHLTLPTIYSV